MTTKDFIYLAQRTLKSTIKRATKLRFSWLLPLALTCGPALGTGPGSGGGSFITEHSGQLLSLAASSLARAVRMSHPDIYSPLESKGMTQEELATIIENVEWAPNETASRGLELRYDYNKFTKTIKALKPFFIAYGGFTPHLFPIEQIWVDLAHEVAHLLDIGTTKDTDRKAQDFGAFLVWAIKHDWLICRAENVKDWPPAQASGELGNKFAVWYINRPTGKGVQFSAAQFSDSVKNYLNEKIIKFGYGSDILEILFQRGREFRADQAGSGQFPQKDGAILTYVSSGMSDGLTLDGNRFGFIETMTINENTLEGTFEFDHTENEIQTNKKLKVRCQSEFQKLMLPR